MVRTFKVAQRDPSWSSTTKGLPKKVKEIVNDKILNHIKNDPYASEALKGPLEGLWSYNKMKSNSRIIFAICCDCRKRGLESVNNCTNCNDFTDDTIMLFAFGGHDLYDEYGRLRKKAWKKAKKKMKSRN